MAVDDAESVDQPYRRSRAYVTQAVDQTVERMRESAARFVRFADLQQRDGRLLRLWERVLPSYVGQERAYADKVRGDLRLAKRHIARAEQLIVEQESLVARLQARGRDATEAERFLRAMRQIVEGYRAHKQAIEQSLCEGEGSSRPNLDGR